MNRIPCKRILIAVEGKNKTEKTYFNNFSNRSQVIKFCSGNETDITGIFNNLIKYMEKNEISDVNGDFIYLVVDLDNDHKKYAEIQKINKKAQKSGIKLIYSNSCFEVWFLLHFQQFTANMSSYETIKALDKFLPNYQKNKDFFPLLIDKTADAIDNAKKACQNIVDNKPFNQTITLVFEIIENIQY